MTHREDVSATQQQYHAQKSSLETQYDNSYLALADVADAQDKALIQAGTDLAAMTQNRNQLQAEFNAYRSKYPATPLPPIVVQPPPTTVKRRTLHGLGGGNVARTGIEVDRRYYASGDKTKMINDTTLNETKGILSVNSMKFPYPWADMATGKGDAWFKDIMAAVSEAIKPKLDDPDDVDEVWFSGHHEPEGDQPDERLWRATQERLSLLVPGGSEGPIKYWLTTTGWNQELNTGAAAARVDWDNLWPTNGDIYGIAYDAPYNTFGKIYKDGVATGEVNTKVTDPYFYIDAVATRAKQFGVEAAHFEWGYSDESFASNPTWRDKVMDRCISNPIQQLLASIYFDTKLNSSHTWYLGDGNTPKRQAHMAAMAARKGR